MGEQVEVRLAGGDDWIRWRDVRLRALIDTPEAFASTYPREAAFTRDDWLQRLAPPAVLALVDGQPVGLGGGFRTPDDRLQVVAMWVDPAWRRRGLGCRILDLVVAWGRQRGLAVQLDVARSNPVARTAYESYGFVATGQSHPLRDGSTDLVDRMVLPA